MELGDLAIESAENGVGEILGEKPSVCGIADGWMRNVCLNAWGWRGSRVRAVVSSQLGLGGEGGL